MNARCPYNHMGTSDIGSTLVDQPSWVMSAVVKVINLIKSTVLKGYNFSSLSDNNINVLI